MAKLVKISRVLGSNRILTCLAANIQETQINMQNKQHGSIRDKIQDRSGKRTVRLEETGSLFCCGSNSFLSSHLYALSFKFSPSSLSSIHFYVAGRNKRIRINATVSWSLSRSPVSTESFYYYWLLWWRCCADHHWAYAWRHFGIVRRLPGIPMAAKSHRWNRSLLV